ncbi:hypothetical protein TRAPUB_8486 [Trametes pubescens]|uniref:Uncharacterized protein n=1 Tax=Trametes pubescens TaxID=154538 RepID=A0A1M2W567_TRAPU|nr:hypothetical protein TRAPUB_8486 [Trametes pubescens]
MSDSSLVQAYDILSPETHHPDLAPHPGATQLAESEGSNVPQRTRNTPVTSTGPVAAMIETYDDMAAVLDGLEADVIEFLQRFSTAGRAVINSNDGWTEAIARYIRDSGARHRKVIREDLCRASAEARDGHILGGLESAVAAVTMMSADIRCHLAEADAMLEKLPSRIPLSKQDDLRIQLNLVREGLTSFDADEASVRSQLNELRPSIQVLSFPETWALDPRNSILEDMEEFAEEFSSVYVDATVLAARQAHALAVIQVCGFTSVNTCRAPIYYQGELDNATGALFMDTPFRRFAVAELVAALPGNIHLRGIIATISERQVEINQHLVQATRNLRNIY